MGGGGLSLPFPGVSKAFPSHGAGKRGDSGPISPANRLHSLTTQRKSLSCCFKWKCRSIKLQPLKKNAGKCFSRGIEIFQLPREGESCINTFKRGFIIMLFKEIKHSAVVWQRKAKLSWQKRHTVLLFLDELGLNKQEPRKVGGVRKKPVSPPPKKNVLPIFFEKKKSQQWDAKFVLNISLEV